MLQMPTGDAAQSVYNPNTGQQSLPSLSTNSLNLANGAVVPNAGTANSMTGDPSIAFGNSLTQMLQKYQQAGNHAQAQLQTGQLNYSDAGINASNTQLTNPQLQGYAPSTILNAGSSAQAPFVTGAEGLKQTGQTFNEQLSNFGDALGNAKTLMQEHQAQQDKAKADAQSIIQMAMTAGGDAINSLIKNQPDLVKLSGLDLATLEAIAASPALKPKLDTNVIEAGGRQLLVNTQTGQTIKDLGSAYHASSGAGSLLSPKATATDVRVAQIIASNPGEYGHAADQIDKEFGKGTATVYDSWLKSVYLGGQPVNNLSPLGGAPAKQATDTQNQSAGYATRLQQANSILGSLQGDISGQNPISFEAQNRAPSYLQSSTFQSYDQAARNFINGVLRRESGAAISSSEFDNAYKQYLPRPNDSSQVLSQKSQNRQTVIDSLIQSAGPGYQGTSNNADPLGIR